MTVAGVEFQKVVSVSTEASNSIIGTNAAQCVDRYISKAFDAISKLLTCSSLQICKSLVQKLPIKTMLVRAFSAQTLNTENDNEFKLSGAKVMGQLLLHNEKEFLKMMTEAIVPEVTNLIDLNFVKSEALDLQSDLAIPSTLYEVVKHTLWALSNLMPSQYLMEEPIITPDLWEKMLALSQDILDTGLVHDVENYKFKQCILLFQEILHVVTVLINNSRSETLLHTWLRSR